MHLLLERALSSYVETPIEVTTEVRKSDVVSQREENDLNSVVHKFLHSPHRRCCYIFHVP